MLMTLLQQFNWVDILVVILSLRIGYIAIKQGAVIEFFKLWGTIFALYISLHYYPIVSDWVRLRAGLKNAPLEFLDFIICLFLAVLGYIFFVAIRSAFVSFVKVQAAPRLNKFGGLLLGITRLILCVSLVVFMLAISGTAYIRNSVRHSYFGEDLFELSTNTYAWIWNKITSKFMLDEELNKVIAEVKERFLRR